MSYSQEGSRNSIIGIDIDNVLSDTDKVIRNLIEKEYGVKASRSLITDWSYAKTLPISEAQEKKVFDQFHNHYCLEAPVIRFAQESLKELSTRYIIWLITCRPLDTTVLTKQWLDLHRFTYDNLVHSCNKKDYMNKISLLIEDNGKTALEYASENIPVILFNNPWNVTYTHSMMFRVNNWPQALNTISMIEHYKKHLTQVPTTIYF